MLSAITRQYSTAASRAGDAVEKTADLWTRGVRQVTDRTHLRPRLPQVDLVPPVERYFDFVQGRVEANRGLTIRFAKAANSLSEVMRERAGSAGDVVRDRAESAGVFVRGKAGTVEQAAREESARAARATRRQAEQAERADQERARDARRIERERSRQVHRRARERYEGMTKSELGDLLEQRDLPKTGNHTELVARLLEADAS